VKFIVGLVAALSGAAVVAGCSPSPSPAHDTANGTLTVFAAASLKSTFTELAAQFEKDNAGMKVRFNFATNTLTIVTPPGNPRGIASFADLAKPDIQVVVCAPQVPCGSATEKVEKAAGVTLSPVSEESSVTDVLGKITSGQADAGLVYVTDAKAAGDKVTAIPFPESGQAVNTYPIVTLVDSKNSTVARKFVDCVTGAQGQSVLTAAGFGKP
jgi:molybdate transport system substrate-binding protein